MSKPKKQIIILVDSETHTAFKMSAAADGTSMTKIIRGWINAHMTDKGLTTAPGICNMPEQTDGE